MFYNCGSSWTCPVLFSEKKALTVMYSLRFVLTYLTVRAFTFDALKTAEFVIMAFPV